MIEVNIALTGHRPNKLDGYDLSTEYYDKMITYIKDILYDLLKDDEVKIVGHTGMALGSDTIWTVCLLDVKEEHPQRVKVVGHIPMEEQANRWNERDRQFWGLMREALDEENVYRKSFPEKGWKDLMFARNEGMIDESDLLLAIYNGENSGTGQSVRYAEKEGKTVKIIHPDLFRNN